MRRNSVSPRLTAEERKIEEERAALLRQQRALEEKLVRLPVELEEQRRQMAQQARQRARSALPPIATAGAGRARRPTVRATPNRRAEASRIKAIALFCIFALILFLVLRAIPAG